jgi:predicted RNA-binding Zn-ribbon protein involved in translation (DUF1610 family)
VNIYKVEFKTVITVDDEGIPVDGMEDDTGGELHNEVIGGDFHVGAYSLAKAFLEASEYLDEHIGEEEYEITAIKEKMNVINWPGEDEPCDCLGCRTERAAEEDKIRFTCKGCNAEIIIVDDFEEIMCPSCGIPILRDRIIGTNNNWVMMDIDKLPKKEFKKEPAKKKRKSKDDNISKEE